jgi:nucleoside diphosphate kinase
MQKLPVQPNIIKKNAEAVLDASKKIGLEVNSEKTKYWVEQKVFAFFQIKSQSFFKIYFQYLINYIISIACIIYVMARQRSKWLKQMTL